MSQICKAVWEALGPDAAVKRLEGYMSKKDYLKGGVNLNQMLHEVNFYIEQCHGKTDKVFVYEDGETRNNKIAKEQLKFKDGYEVIANLPAEFKDVKYDLETSIAALYAKPEKSYKTWMKESGENARSKGDTQIFFDKIVPAIHKSKFNVNTTETNGNDKAKFMTAWKKENVDCSKDHARIKSIADDLSPKLANMDKNLVIVDLPEVKAKIGPDVKVCWSCISEVCRTRQRIAMTTTAAKQKFVNKGCQKGKLTVGSKDTIKVLTDPISKDAYAVVKPIVKKKIHITMVMKPAVAST